MRMCFYLNRIEVKYLGQGSNLHSRKNQILRVVWMFRNLFMPKFLQILWGNFGAHNEACPRRSPSGLPLPDSTSKKYPTVWQTRQMLALNSAGDRV